MHLEINKYIIIFFCNYTYYTKKISSDLPSKIKSIVLNKKRKFIHKQDYQLHS